MLLVYIVFLGLVTHSLGGGEVPSKCQPQEPKCGKNEVYVVASSACRKTCANQHVPDCGTCKPYTGCACEKGYMRLNDDATGPCVKENRCPKNTCTKCGVNEVYKKERTKCPPQTCKSLYIKYSCAPTDPEPGCDCINSYLRNDNGTCIPKEKCPPLPQLPQCGENEVSTTNRIVCPPQTCESKYTLYKCDPNREPEPGCDCIKGYLRDRNGVCIPSEKCPGLQPVCGENEVATDDRIICPPQSCESIYSSYMCEEREPEPGCDCIDGYLRDYDGVCIPSEQCFMSQPVCGENEVATDDRIICPPQSCESIYTSYMCEEREPEPGCDCIDGYLRDYDGVCIPSEQCFMEPEEECGYNEVWSQTKVGCPPQTCESQYIHYPCAYLPPQPGCVCIDNHLRNKSGICIPQEQCPPPPTQLKGCNGDPNATSKKCPNPCAPTCDNPNPSGVCNKLCVATGCECNPGYLQYNNTCVLPKDCPEPEKECGYNEVWSPKKLGCPPQTCESQYINYPCAYSPPQPGCVCIDNHLRNKSGICIPQEQCPPPPTQLKGCNGDPNATSKKCPNPCAPTCDNPNPSGVCNKMCLATGCECNPGYLRYNNTCVLPKDCPGGVKCPANEQFVNCKIDCPNNYCRVNDIRAILICDPAFPCPSGCVCNGGYFRKSSKDKQCIKASECPPVNCTRPNEVWKSNMPVCLRDRCEDANKVPTSETCNRPNRDLRPQCVCRDGYYRNDSDICVPASECPFICPISEKCKPTCVVPNPKNCPAVMPAKTNVDGCQCQNGYILSEPGGKCIRIQDCPKNQSCNGDPNAVVRSCPRSCKSTCSKPNGQICYNNCTVGCECSNGYILSKENGRCIKLDDCAGGNPCGPNGTFVGCAIRCPNQYCPKDNRNVFYGCDPPYPCPSGCACKSGYKRLNTEDRCVLSSDCPFVCPIDERCRPTCANPSPNYCPAILPAKSNIDGCECQAGYILSESRGKCVRVEECPQNQSCGGDVHAVIRSHPWPCRATCGQVSSANCSKKSVYYGCECEEGYILSKDNGKCIKVTECPGGDPCAPNATYSTFINSCPGQYCVRELERVRYPCDPVWPTPAGCVCKSDYLRLYDGDNRCVLASDCPFVCPIFKKCRPTCAVPNPKNCPAVMPAKTNIDGCQCQNGYILSEAGGKCIRIQDCPKNQSCNGDPNAVVRSCLRSCKSTCSKPNGQICHNNCTVDCECSNGYILSEENGRCIKLDDCAGGNPCGPNGTFVGCANRCPDQYCPKDNRNGGCHPPYPCSSGCTCKSGYKRLKTEDRCVLSSDCPFVCPIDVRCRPTCANPSPNNCPARLPAKSNIDGCECQAGYILSEARGKCIRVEECPQNQSCGGDVHAVIRSHPWPCRATCGQVSSANCSKKSVYYGCECEEGYILSKDNGKCIKVTECPGGDPCAPNATYSTFINSCPGQYCVRELERVRYACDPIWPTAAGCVCKSDYLRLYDGDNRCVLASDCPPVCPIYAECRPTCAKPNPGRYELCPEVAPATTNVDGCQCQDGYILESPGGKCIRIEECQQNQGCDGDSHAVVKSCPSSCPPTCSNPDNRCVNKKCNPPDCVCVDGYIRSEENGKCILPGDCKGGDPCGVNATFSSCSYKCPENYCPKDDSNGPVCDPIFPCPPGCMCKPNHKRLSYEDERCILASDCRPVNCTRKNEVWSPCSSPCPGEYCQDPNEPPIVCNTLLLNCEPKCVCAKGYSRDRATDLCIPTEECPNNNPCSSKCTPTCAEPNPPCDNLPAKNCCEDGYILSERNGLCIRIDECPRNVSCNGDPHAIVKQCPPACPATCDHPETTPCKKTCLAIGCDCAPGYIRSGSDGKCILATQCPGGDPCGPNGTFVSCSARCPNQYCPKTDSPFQIACMPPYNCPPGCACKLNHKRLSNEDDRCILAPDCPPLACKTRPNEVWSSCPSACLRENCRDVNEPQGVCYTLVWNCDPRCICEDGYFRNGSEICIPAKQCPEYINPCESKCAPTCAEPNPPNCTEPIKACCADGYILSERGGKCVKIDECTKDIGCNGDPHAEVQTCPAACPSTCDHRDPTREGLCEKKCLAVGCQCSPGYIRSTSDGKCILPDECPGGDPCGPNGTYVDCGFRCPNQYCPQDDSGIKYACKPGRPCPPGCGCKLNYKRLSYEDDRCILATECPPLECKTRPNEVWSSCPSACLAEGCTNVNDPPSICETLVLNCEPNCICEQGYYRNSSDICVPAQECEGFNPCQSKCTPTCKQPNPPDCANPPTKTCCEDGYILSEWNGTCIKIEECPRGCSGDPNAVVKQCPNPCPSTCQAPNAIPCRRACLAVGCQCAPGYLRSEPDGLCIKPNECPGGNPCGQNEVFVPCKTSCPTDFCPVDDSRAVMACSPPNPCLSGCICRVNHKRKSIDDQRCIMSSDCPSVECTSRPNEEWSSCPSACLQESCKDVGKKPVTCNTLVLNCEPRCVCCKNYYRNGTDICVSPDECECQ